MECGAQEWYTTGREAASIPLSLQPASQADRTSRVNPTGTFTFQGPAGDLEAIYREGQIDSTRVAVVCHPHPQHGGTMHNKVVHRAAKAFESVGYPTLRFNYRGVGRSEGLFDDGLGEADDVKAAINWLAAERPGSDVVLCGFSFGAVVGLSVGAADERVRSASARLPTASLFTRWPTSANPNSSSKVTTTSSGRSIRCATNCNRLPNRGS